jgi:hypothetical protein
MERYNLIEDGTIHTEGLSLEWANEMLERYTETFPQSEYWIEPVGYRG